MSKSQSPTPTPTPSTTTLPINPLSHSESTPSRLYPHENSPSVNTTTEREQATLRPTDRPSFRSPSPEPHSNQPTRRRRSAESSPDQPMAKRLRKQSSDSRAAPEHRSSPSSDSQSGMADTEMEGRRERDSEASPPPTVAPAKKKRTRTLTTPHQSAVLHALLAQSRFPTTAMREEVGRSIGLSARKVQIWFQNQRQKARRPRSESATPLAHPPQYSPFQNSNPTAPSSSYDTSLNTGPRSASTLGAYEYDSRRLEQPGYNRYRPSESYTGTTESPSQLLGPGMPGPDMHSRLPFRAEEMPGRSPEFEPPRVPPSTSGRPFAEPATAGSRGSGDNFRSRPMSLPVGFQMGSAPRGRDSSRTLPPLNFNIPYHRSSFSAPGPSTIYPSLSRTSDFVQPSAFESPFSHHIPEHSREVRPTLNIPPPFTLQPQPQWDNSFPTIGRPQGSTWPGRSSFPERRLSTSQGLTPRPTHTPHSSSMDTSSSYDHASPQETPMSPESSRSVRSGRYDPVRATFVPYANSPPSSPTQSRANESNEDNHHDDHSA